MPSTTSILVVAIALQVALPYICGAASSACSTPMDCQLNGDCVGNMCVCDKGWKGPTCGELNLDPTFTVAYGYGGVEPKTSSWGGGPPVYDNATGMYHLFVTEIAGNCGMSTWGRMSQAAHGVSPIIEGPYKRVGLAVQTQAHNIFYAFSPPDKMHLIFHIFAGESPESCNPYLNCTNGTTPGGHGLRPPTPWPAPSCGLGGGAYLHYSKSLDGPWQSAGALKVRRGGMPPQGGSSNPAPYIFPNGTVIMMGRGKDSTGFPNGTRVINHNIMLYRAESWNGTYEWVKGTGVNGAVNIGNGKIPTEDPVLYKGRRGFHTILHSHPDLTHAWSQDGLVWEWSSEVIGPSDVPGGSDNERPRVVVDANGDLDVLFVSQEIGPGDASRTVAFKARHAAQ